MNGDEQVVNEFGVSIKKCCASCSHKAIDYDGHRTCNVLGLKVQSKFKCRSWEMSYGLRKVGKGLGTVHHFASKKPAIG